MKLSRRTHITLVVALLADALFVLYWVVSFRVVNSQHNRDAVMPYLMVGEFLPSVAVIGILNVVAVIFVMKDEAWR